MAKACRPGFGKGDRIAFFVDVARIGVDFIKEDPAGRHRPKPDRAIRPGQKKDAAGELLPEGRIPRIPRPGGADKVPKDRTVFDQRV